MHHRASLGSLSCMRVYASRIAASSNSDNQISLTEIRTHGASNTIRLPLRSLSICLKLDFLIMFHSIAGLGLQALFFGTSLCWVMKDLFIIRRRGGRFLPVSSGYSGTLDALKIKVAGVQLPFIDSRPEQKYACLREHSTAQLLNHFTTHPLASSCLRSHFNLRLLPLNIPVLAF